MSQRASSENKQLTGRPRPLQLPTPSSSTCSKTILPKIVSFFRRTSGPSTATSGYRAVPNVGLLHRV